MNRHQSSSFILDGRNFVTPTRFAILPTVVLFAVFCKPTHLHAGQDPVAHWVFDQTHVEGQTVKVYSIPKTLADLFKYRNKVGIEVALEALREAWRERRFTMDEIDRYAKICRVERVMRPYLEALVG